MSNTLASQASMVLRKSHICSYYSYCLEITSSLVADFPFEASRIGRSRLDLWINALSHLPGLGALDAFDRFLKYFLASAQWDSQLVLDIIDNNPSLYNTSQCLKRLSLSAHLDCSLILPNGYASRARKEPTYFGPDRDISFGHYTLIIQCVRSALLTSPTTQFVHFRAPSEFCAFPDFYELMHMPMVQTIDLGREPISALQLLQYHENMGSERTRDYWNNSLLQQCGIQSDNAYIPYKASSASCKDILLLANKYINKLFASSGSQPSFIENECLKRFVVESLAAKRRFVCFTPRDSIYSGPSQPWRDTDVNSYHQAILWLISIGYSVVRLNPDGGHINLRHKYLFDNTIARACVADQFRLLYMCHFVFGSSTGSTEYSSQLFGRPTLYLDTAGICNSGTLVEAVHASKKLCVSDRHIFSKVSVEQLSKFLFGSCWSYADCESLGLAINNLSSDAKLNAVKRFMDSIAGNRIMQPTDQLNTTLTLQRLLWSEHVFPPMIIDYESSINLISVIKEYLRCSV